LTAYVLLLLKSCDIVVYRGIAWTYCWIWIAVINHTIRMKADVSLISLVVSPLPSMSLLLSARRIYLGFFGL